MEMLKAIALAEPTFLGQVGAGVVHMMIWTWIGSWEFGLMKFIRVSMERLERLWNEVLPKNYQGDPSLEICGCEDNPGIIFVWNCLTVIHHGVTGGCMLAGYMTGWASLWRHGMLIQLAGMDILDIFKMLYCTLQPPGPFPTCEAMKSKTYPRLLLFHHTVSILVGLPVNLYFSHLPEFQWFGVVITGGPLLSLVPDLLSRLVASFPAQTAVEVWGCLVFAYQRLIFYFSQTYALLKIVGESEEVPWPIKGGFVLGAFNLSAFNLLAFAILTASLLQKLQPDSEARGISAANAMNLASIAVELFPERSVDRCNSMPTLGRPLLLSVDSANEKSIMKSRTNRF
eukprot:TRINITY_DN3602_c0_g4_i1.p1 TRINITY_DN3602_c0_g4~~TRINITY_DN3602_c0_g4_i1.p1  ORF type:complete len:342 (-),score=48.39 TRINITY_DN3602_c0_g4_i1:237-1262(-)